MFNPGVSAVHRIRPLVTVYVAVVIATLAALAVLTAAGSTAATTDAWVHALVVGVFAVLLPLRVRAAGRGSSDALRAVGIIAAVLLAANLVEAAIPGAFPVWMRVEMVGIAVLMGAIVWSAVDARRVRTR